jgi:hypothetical protein
MSKIAPLRRITGLDDRVIYCVQRDPARPVSDELLECGHIGHYRERNDSDRPPHRRRCPACLKIRAVQP